MSVWSARRQFAFLIIALFIFALMVGGAVWWFWPRPTCQDGRRNQTEGGVDCGGVCPAVCQTEAQSVRVWWTRVLPLGVDTYDLAVLVENPNADLILVKVSYSLRVVDQDNLFINRIRGTLTLAPRERSVIFVSNVEVGRRVPVRAQLDFTDSPRWRRSTDKPLLSVGADKNFINTPTPLLVAKITNNSLKSYQGIEVAATLSDGDRNAFAASATVVSELAAGATREISFSWPRPFAADPIFIDFYPHVAALSDVY